MKVKNQWVYLYHAVDSKSNAINFYLKRIRYHRTAKRFFKKTLRSFYFSKLRGYYGRQEPYLSNYNC
ncbi:DDE-type integrase/transposase/recombinase [Bacillus sp. XF8]|nr:DDE-type integrase/transposase/recombinase [Bacillus sp. XF8]